MCTDITFFPSLGVTSGASGSTGFCRTGAIKSTV
jgi:hypothetical protein